MTPVTVVVDTTHYMPAEVVERHSLQQVPLYVNWNGRTDRETDLADFDAYYDHLRSAGQMPTTSQPSVGDFLACYEPLIADGRDIVSIHISGAISGTVGAAQQAREALVEQGVDPARIVIVDSRTACAPLGLLGVAAANAIAGGATAQEAADAALALRREVNMWFAVDTLEFLRRGGRIGAARAMLGSTLKIKPILTFEDEITPVGRVRTSARAFERMVDYLRMRCDDGHDAWYIQHVQAHEQAARLVDKGREIFGTDPDFVSEIGPVIGTHVGPGLLGVSAVRRDLVGRI
jgi:DegV family protein with EDD domain